MNIWKRLRLAFGGHKAEKDLYSQTLGALQVEDKGSYSLVTYQRDGVFDYEAYRRIQTEGNKRKLTTVFVQQEVISALADYATARGPVRRVICHGTRNAAEQGFFKAAIPGVDVLGTEISDTATQFPDTIEWDFHEIRADWPGAFDILYSNSWDHSYDPIKLFAAWSSCVAPGGIMTLEHSSRHEPKAVNALDPFGVDFDGLVSLVTANPGMTFEAALDFGGRRQRRLAIFRKAGD